MSNEMLELQIASAPVRDRIPKDAPLRERISFAMRYVREHERDLFWMTGHVNDDLMMRAALAAVMSAGDESDRDIIARSLKPLRMLAAAISGIPVDFGAMEMSDDLIPLVKLWDESKGPQTPSAASGESAGALGLMKPRGVWVRPDPVVEGAKDEYGT